MRPSHLPLPPETREGLGRGSFSVDDEDHGDARGKFESDDDGNAVVAETLTNIWWMALDAGRLPTKDITNSLDALGGDYT